MIVPLFYPILDRAFARSREVDPVEAAEAILDAGARILQYRHKGFFSSEIFEELERVARLCEGGGASLIVNDRADVARLLGAGVHLGQQDLSPSDARVVLGSTALVGFSTHNESQLRAGLAEPADYLALGPIFGTSSKENPDPAVGLDELRRLRPLVEGRPLVAIGGITRANAGSVLEAGADSVAVIGDLFPEDGNIAARVREWTRL